GKYVGHCIVIKGYDSENFYLNDPYWPERNTTKIPKYRLIAGIYSSKIPEILVIE
ncbi:MAG: C39 family peptidase, partial [Candidatus Aenigmarchaeota archaeon]|nr:C39 family peptidase [Candidatus Aenigmarchaeota archaeon]